jgi:hypothetical protein
VDALRYLFWVAKAKHTYRATYGAGVLAQVWALALPSACCSAFAFSRALRTMR